MATFMTLTHHTNSASSALPIMADSPPASLSCPVCFEAYSLTEGSAFALHVSSCSRSSLSPLGSPSSPTAHCPLCLHVYTAGTPAYEIAFHEHECARVNKLPDESTDDGPSSIASNRHNKRQRNDAVTPSAPSVTLFPSTCFLCGNGGRGLLHCSGKCARAAHQTCVNQLQAFAVGELMSISERRQAADNWKCAQCVRHLHWCHRCGFLGHKANGMRKCIVVNCGHHFHAHCLPAGAKTTGFVCPRHTCVACNTQETDMKRCNSCTLCNHMTHLRCPKGSGGTATGSTGLDSNNLFECPRHDTETRTSLTNSFDASNSLRQRLAAGDVVLVLEFNNALLPSSAKEAAPDAANLWGVVISAEETEPHRRGNQLLSVRMFADDNVLVVPNQYALRVATALEFSRPVDLLSHCLQHHAMVELQLRRMEGEFDEAEEKRILGVSEKAFAARLKALGMTAAQITSDTEQGLARWRRFQDLPQPRQYDGIGDSAPSFLFIDTRGRRYEHETTSIEQSVKAVTADIGENTFMTDPGIDDGVINGIARGSPHVTASLRPTEVGKSPHEIEGEKHTDKSVIVVDEAFSSQQNSSQDTIVSKTSLSVSAHISNTSNKASGLNVKKYKRTVDSNGCADVKRRKTDLDTFAELQAPISTPTNFRGLHSGATSSRVPASATLHMSPMASRAIFPQKRKQMTRKQKLLADMPPLLLKELKREVFRYLEDADGSRQKSTRIPPDADAFPWAARTASLRPAFYRSTVMLGHSGLRRPGVDAISRLLVSQDKRSIKCFVQTTEDDTDLTRCSHVASMDSSSASPGFVFLDLMSLHGFRELELVVRTRLVEALDSHSRYTRNHFGMDVHQVQRWLERQRRRKISEQPPIFLSYCVMDGIRYQLKRKQLSLKSTNKDKQAWVCFCANACHLSVAIAVPRMPRAVSGPIASAVKQKTSK